VSAGPLPFADDEFDLAFSNATIEHAGTRAAQAEFVRELVRVARRSFVVTPNRWFPVELHTRLPFVHWLPPRSFARASAGSVSNSTRTKRTSTS